jgi:hypothetical protein
VRILWFPRNSFETSLRFPWINVLSIPVKSCVGERGGLRVKVPWQLQQSQPFPCPRPMAVAAWWWNVWPVLRMWRFLSQTLNLEGWCSKFIKIHTKSSIWFHMYVCIYNYIYIYEQMIGHRFTMPSPKDSDLFADVLGFGRWRCSGKNIIVFQLMQVWSMVPFWSLYIYIYT